MKRLLLILISFLTLCMVIASCKTKEDVIIIPTDATWPPFEYVDTETHEIVGFDIDLFNEIAKRLGINVRYINVTWDPLLAGISQGTYKIAISAITIKESRFDRMDFSIPYYTSGQVLVVRVSEIAIQSLSDCSGKTIGAESGTTADDMIRSIPGGNAAIYDDIGIGMTALLNHQIDAVLCDEPLALDYVKRNPELKIVGDVMTNEDYGIAYTKGYDTELQNKINETLEEIFRDGTYDGLKSKWGLR